MVEIKIIGAHKQVLELSVEESVVAQTELKIQSGNGYDHFVLDHHDLHDGRDVPVFVWDQRTRIAE
ncbi:DUF5988 family protein [Amycolatopsis acidiphila]|uniref:Uncharacterized protein n=1 Tax=Amycolatopsis acidiphila TaxID=715473 RepID=A0A557ZZX5_9PSEU|nr:DUF5988 family protein [Amycolatopsis acidiphila]TVT17568.1 hypothetical protein FNH06_30810 [Amycolatopsis acidiphila]UIJ60527.1 DUF5988 family protein [Amycolatopsis acidiphila]